MAGIGYNTRFSIENAPGSGVFVELAEVYEVTPPNASVDQVDVTHYQSAGKTREFIPGLVDGGTVTVSMNFAPNSVTDQRIEGLKLAGTVLAMRVTFPNGATATFPAGVQSYTKAIPVDDKMTATMEVKVAGAVTIAAASAPVNQVLPAISGVATNGSVLTAFEGLWSQMAAFTYQWRKGGVNIAGATARSFTLTASEVGGGIDVVVTATNSAGNASATSVRTVNVV